MFLLQLYRFDKKVQLASLSLYHNSIVVQWSQVDSRIGSHIQLGPSTVLLVV
jgi:hypothetical protein